MAYISKNLSELTTTIGGRGARWWAYWTADAIGTVTGAGYVTDAANKRMQVGDVVWVLSGTLNTTGPDQSPSTHAAGTVSEFASDPTLTICTVTSIASGAATLTAAALSGDSFANPTLTGTIKVGGVSDTVGFYGAAPVAQMASIAAITTTQPTLTVFGFTTTAQFDALINAVNQIIADLKTAGLMTSP